jgi:hypothetical protein
MSKPRIHYICKSCILRTCGKCTHIGAIKILKLLGLDDMEKSE